MLMDMAKFLNTRKAVAQIEDLIRNAGEKLILVSPYLKLSKDFKELLIHRNNNNKITTVIFGKEELKPDEMKFLESLRFVILKFNENLHAKCYVNEKQMIITSLNLYEFSMANNKEMGVLINVEDESDKLLYEEAYNEIKYIEDTSEKFNFNFDKTSDAVKPLSKSRYVKSEVDTGGHCIRCDAGIKFDAKVPLCKKCYQIWKKHSDGTYEEKFCHKCGKKTKSSMDAPQCYSCFKKK